MLRYILRSFKWYDFYFFQPHALSRVRYGISSARATKPVTVPYTEHGKLLPAR